MTRTVVATLAVAVLLSLTTATALGSSFWNVWSGNLPDSNGVRAKHSLYLGGGALWYIRMSWTSNTHDMYFSWILNNGSWANLSALTYGTEDTGYWDRYISYYPTDFVSGVAEGGCNNPGTLSTVWTNCRNAGSPN